MDALDIALIAVLGLGIGWSLVQFRRPRRVWYVGDAKGELEVLNEERALTLRTLKDLEQEFNAGKLNDEVYQRLRDEAMNLAATQTARLDELRAEVKSVRAAIEAEIKQRTGGGEAQSSSDDAAPREDQPQPEASAKSAAPAPEPKAEPKADPAPKPEAHTPQPAPKSADSTPAAPKPARSQGKKSKNKRKQAAKRK